MSIRGLLARIAQDPPATRRTIADLLINSDGDTCELLGCDNYNEDDYDAEMAERLADLNAHAYDDGNECPHCGHALPERITR